MEDAHRKAGVNMPEPAATTGTTQFSAALSNAINDAAYLCVFSRSDAARPNTPHMRATNPIGTLLLRSGAMSVFKAVGDLVGPDLMEPLVKVMPLELYGVDVREELHRMDVRLAVPDGRGIRAVNTIGEAVGTVEMKWRPAPDDFEPAPGRVPPPTALDVTRSQRFVMLDGVQRYRDGSGLRGYGSGRTYPIVVNGVAQLRIAAVVDVVEGFGKLAGLTGTIVVNGHIAPPYGLFINFVARFVDPAHQLLTSAPLTNLEPQPPPDPDTAFIVVLGEPDPLYRAARRSTGRGAVETTIRQRLRVIRTGFDASEGLRSHVDLGAAVGYLTADLRLDISGNPAAFSTANTAFTFTDRDGRVVGTLNADIVHGRVFGSGVDGSTIYRLGGFGPLLGGTGAFDGAVGMLTTNQAVSDETLQQQSSLYVIRISDAAGRFRAAAGDTQADRSMPARSRTAEPLDGADRQMLERVEATRLETRQIFDWWAHRERTGRAAERFDLVRDFDRDERAYGFFDSVTVSGTPMPVMGVVQEMLYDRTRSSSAEHVCAQLREFVFAYLTRVCHRCRPDSGLPPGTRPGPAYLRPFSWLPDEKDERLGFGYEQLLAQVRATGEILKFGAAERGAVFDLRELGRVYDWLAMRVNIFDFKIGVSPFGGDFLRMELPLKQVTFVLALPELIVDRRNPEPGILGEFGFGYGLLPYAAEKSAFAYGPGHFGAGFQTFLFTVLATGEIRAKAVFVANRPTKILNVDVDPVGWGFAIADTMTFNLASRTMAPFKALAEKLPLKIAGVDPVSLYISAANGMSGGLAEKVLGISKAQLEKHMLLRHVIQHREMLLSSHASWRMVADWTDASSLPDFCHRGLAT